MTAPRAPQAEYTRKELDDLQGLLDARLAKDPYVLGPAFSLADLILASAVGYGAMGGVSVDSHARA